MALISGCGSDVQSLPKGQDCEIEFAECEDHEELPAVSVVLSAGNDRFFTSVIQTDGMMSLPEGLVRELGLDPGDDLEWNLNEEEGVIYLKAIHRDWEIPEWLQD